MLRADASRGGAPLRTTSEAQSGALLAGTSRHIKAGRALVAAFSHLTGVTVPSARGRLRRDARGQDAQPRSFSGTYSPELGMTEL